MTASTQTAATATVTDTDVARAVFQAFADADLTALDGLLHAGATWHHRNSDRLGGIHEGSDAIIGYLAQSAQLSAGTLRAVPQSFMADGQGHVCVLVRLSARPPRRALDGWPADRAVHPRRRPRAQHRPVRRRPCGRGRVLGLIRPETR